MIGTSCAKRVKVQWLKAMVRERTILDILNMDVTMAYESELNFKENLTKNI
ncbi:MAG TPA: hypothetical protein VM123_08705 [archaeon]|nr:hypothetical protein [archaeon]